MHPEETHRAQLLSTSHALHARGWVANHDGNASVMLEEGRFLATPTAVSKGAVTAESLIVVSAEGKVLSGTRKLFSEWKLHAAAYAVRGDVRAVLHAHPPTATGLAVAGVSLGEPFMAEPIVSLGRHIPTVSFGLPGENDASLAEALSQADALLLENHGALTVGPDLETCLLRMELLEHLCRIYGVAAQLGGPRRLPEALVAKLHEQHEKLFPRVITGASEAIQFGAAPASPAPVGSARDIVAEALRRIG